MTKFVHDSRTVSNCTSIEDLIAEVAKIKSKYPEATNIEIAARTEYDSGVLEIDFDRPQTEEERAKEAKWKKDSEEQERAAYERLRKKFEGKS
jgi:hypothetical protein